jgi:hypothetical protein
MNYTRQDVHNLFLRLWHGHRLELRLTHPQKMRRLGRNTSLISGNTMEAILHCSCGWESGAFQAYNETTGQRIGTDSDLALEHMISQLEHELQHGDVTKLAQVR